LVIKLIPYLTLKLSFLTNLIDRSIEKLLDEYRHKDPDGYNNEGFARFIIGKGYEARLLEPEESFYF
jgi:hypothetical protein